MTRSGLPVNQLTVFENCSAEVMTVVGVIEGRAYLTRWTREGTRYTRIKDTPFDLCMAPKKRTLFLNVWSYGNGDYCSALFPDAGVAERTAENRKKCKEAPPIYHNIALPLEVEE